MANFLAVVDPDPARRALCVAGAGALLEVMPSLRWGCCASERFAAVWQAAELAPVSAVSDGDGAGVLFGDALDTGGARADAAHVRRAWCDATHRPSPPEPWDGFYAAVAYDTRSGLVAGADMLGAFPVYYWSDGDVAVVGSSIAAFRSHPSFRSEFDPLGLTGILLTGGLLDGHTMWKDVRRLSPGHLLTWSSERGTREVRHYAIPIRPTSADRLFEEHVAMLDEGLDRTVVKHVSGECRNGLLLSGGRDSRVVAGLMHRRGMANGAHALTLGRPHDYEVQCAAAVAETLGIAHTVTPDPLRDVEVMACRHLRHEQLANGMANFYTWGMVPLLPACGVRVLSGYWIEVFISGTFRRLPGGPADDADPFGRVLRAATSYGLAPHRLRRLAPREVFGDAVDLCIERMRAQFTARDIDADGRSWQFAIEHRGRYHSGSTPWRMSLGAWPTLLALDRALVGLCASFPMSTLVARRAEDELLRTRFPALARLPLDRNSAVTDPLLSSAASRVPRFIRNRLRTALRGRRLLRNASEERRRYYRLYDINSPMWNVVRRLAEKGRARATDVLDRDELNSLLPPPDVRIELRDPITDSNGLKALLGFLIWWSDHA